MKVQELTPLPPVQLSDPKTPAAVLQRIGALVRRHWYVIRSSGPRALELVFWPLVSMLTWGFLQLHLAATTSLPAKAAGLLIGGVLLWDISGP